MKAKFLAAAFLVSVMVLAGAAVSSYAFEHGGKRGHHLDFETKFFKKAMMIFSNREELGLSDEQVAKIKELKTSVKKDLIRKEAEIEITAIDIEAEAHKDPMDTNAVIKLVEKKYDLKKEKEKSLVRACAALKGTLTKEQKEKLEGLWKKCEKEKMGQGRQEGGMEGVMRCQMAR
jgi:Spy/CpxP family protein refolding chaperone